VPEDVRARLRLAANPAHSEARIRPKAHVTYKPLWSFGPMTRTPFTMQGARTAWFKKK